MSVKKGGQIIAGTPRTTGGIEIGDIGIAPFGIDESLNLRRYLNGQVISQSQFQSFTTKIKRAVELFPNLSATEENWQAEVTNSKLGQCGKFVIDDEADTIRLPKAVNINSLQDLVLIGGIKVESLPNISGYTSVTGVSNLDTPSTGPFTKNVFALNADYQVIASSVNGLADSYFDASSSSSTYQDNAPVQQEAVQYPYFIQVATGTEESLPAIREYEINTPFFFGQSMYSKNAPYNASWLASNGQYNASSLYPDFWTQLTGVELNTSLNVGDTIEIGGKTYVKRGLPVVLSTDTITDYDFVVNQNDQTFRLPLLNGEENWVGNSSTTLSTADIVSETPFAWTATKNGFIKFTCFRQNMTQAVIAKINGQTIVFSGVATATTTPRPGFWLKVKKGDVVTIEAENETLQYVDIAFIPAVGNGTLYYYVGETIQDASLINAGAVLGQLSNKADINLSNVNNTGNVAASNLNSKGIRTVVETYENGTEWYRVWSDGWCEQGGIITPAATSTIYTANFIMPFKDGSSVKSMNIQSRLYSTATQPNDVINQISGSQFNYITGNPAMVNYPMYWSACGIIE